MAHEPGYMVRKNLYEIDLYAKKSLDAFREGIDVIPDWIHHKVATVRTHMKDAGHFVRWEAHEGRRYGARNKHEMGIVALQNISEYASAIQDALEKGQRPLPEWVQNKLSISASMMDRIGHYLESRVEGRRYSYPAWQTEEFQRDYKGPRAYGQVIEFDDRRGVAAVGGVRWVPPPALPGERRYSRTTTQLRLTNTGPAMAHAARRFGVPGHPYGTPGWAGQAGVETFGGCIRGARNKRGLKQMPHVYGSMGYGSMGDGSMDLATGGERMRRYSQTCVCPECGGPMEEIDERTYSRSPDLKDPFGRERCFNVIGWDGQPKRICVKSSGKLKTKTKTGPDLKDPFRPMKRGPQLSARGSRGGRRIKRRRRGNYGRSRR